MVRLKCMPFSVTRKHVHPLALVSRDVLVHSLRNKGVDNRLTPLSTSAVSAADCNTRCVQLLRC